jgi:hypothetical protein
VKSTIIRKEKQTSDCKKVFAIHLCDKNFHVEYIEFSKLYSKKINNPIEKYSRDLNWYQWSSWTLSK